MAARTPVVWLGAGDRLGVLSLGPRGPAEVAWASLAPLDRSAASDGLGVLLAHRRGETAPRAFGAEMMQAMGGGGPDDAAMARLAALEVPPGGWRDDESGRGEAEARRMAWDAVRMFFVDAERGINNANVAAWFARSAGAFLDPDAHSAARAVNADLRHLRNVEQPELKANFWNCLAALVAVGWTSKAAEELGLHSSWRTEDGASDALEAVALLLRQRPRDDADVPPAERARAHAAWSGEARRLLDAADVWATCRHASDVDGLQQVLLVLAGDDTALAASTSTWVELLVARVVHARSPALTRAQLKALAESCYAEKPPAGNSADLLEMTFELLGCCADGDAQGVVRAVADQLGPWFVAHVLEMLPVGDAQLPELGCTQGEYYRLQLALALLPHTATRPIALRYLTLCPTYGPGMLDATLLRLPAAQDGDTAHLSILPAVGLAEQLGLARAARAATERAG